MVLFVMPKPLLLGQTQRSCEVRVARIRRSSLADVGKPVEVDVLGDVVNRNIEARRVSHVEYIERKFQGGALGYLGYLLERDVGTPLPGLAENIALAVVDEVRLVGIIGRNRAVQSTWTQQRNAKTAGLERESRAGARSPGERLLGAYNRREERLDS